MTFGKNFIQNPFLFGSQHGSCYTNLPPAFDYTSLIQSFTTYRCDNNNSFQWLVDIFHLDTKKSFDYLLNYEKNIVKSKFPPFIIISFYNFVFNRLCDVDNTFLIKNIKNNILNTFKIFKKVYIIYLCLYFNNLNNIIPFIIEPYNNQKNINFITNFDTNFSNIYKLFDSIFNDYTNQIKLQYLKIENINFTDFIYHASLLTK